MPDRIGNPLTLFGGWLNGFGQSARPGYESAIVKHVFWNQLFSIRLWMKKYTVLFLVMIAWEELPAEDMRSGPQHHTHYFIENKGQWPEEVLYLTRLRGLDVWITTYGINFTFYHITDPFLPEPVSICQLQQTAALTPSENHDRSWSTVVGQRVLVTWQNQPAFIRAEGTQRRYGYYNYLFWRNQQGYATYVGLYDQVLVHNVFDAIDVRYYFDRGGLRFDFLVRPGADPRQIQFALSGSDKHFINDAGHLEFATRFGPVQFTDLVAYQAEDQRKVSARFAPLEIPHGDLSGSGDECRWTFRLGSFDRSQTLIIDPLVYATFLGGSENDRAYDVGVDGSGQLVVVGETLSPNYDTTPGVFQATKSGGRDVFITKLNAAGTGLIYSSFLGGSQDDIARCVLLDSIGQVLVAGWTYSSDFSVTTDAVQTSHGGGSDVFVAKLDAAGAALLYATYLGGSGDDEGWGLTIDKSGNTYVTGQTYSADFPVTTGAWQSAQQGGWDAFVTKLNASGTTLLFSTYLGGGNADYGRAIVVNKTENAYVAGRTYSADFPTVGGAYQTVLNGGSDVFVVQIDSSGSTPIYASYLGGSSDEHVYDLVVDGMGNCILTGRTYSSDYVVTSNVVQPFFGGGSYDVFVTQFNALATDILFSTYLGGTDTERGNSLALDNMGNIHLVGETHSADFDISPDAWQSGLNGLSDVFYTVLNTDGTALLYSTFLGGSGEDEGWALALDDFGNVYLSGRTNSDDFFITPGAFQTVLEGGYDVFVSKLHGLGTGMASSAWVRTGITVFPNPTDGCFFIQSNVPGTLELLDLSGQVLYTFYADPNERRIFLELPAGLYVLRQKNRWARQLLCIGF